MDRILRILKLVFVALVMTFAAAGAGMGIIFPNHRDKYMEPEVKIELVEKKEEEVDEEEEEVKG